MNNNQRQSGVVFAPTMEKTVMEKINPSLQIEAKDFNDDKVEDEWILIWHNVRVKDKKTASELIKNNTNSCESMKVNPKYLSWFQKQLRPSKWERFKRWLLQLFRSNQET